MWTLHLQLCLTIWKRLQLTHLEEIPYSTHSAQCLCLSWKRMSAISTTAATVLEKWRRQDIHTRSSCGRWQASRKTASLSSLRCATALCPVLALICKSCADIEQDVLEACLADMAASPTDRSTSENLMSSKSSTNSQRICPLPIWQMVCDSSLSARIGLQATESRATVLKLLAFLQEAAYIDRRTATIDISLLTFTAAERIFGSWVLRLQRMPDGRFAGRPVAQQCDELLYSATPSGAFRFRMDVAALVMNALHVFLSLTEVWRIVASEAQGRVCLLFRCMQSRM